MDFVTTHAPPVPIKVNGKPYQVPRFLLPEQEAWVALKVQEQIDKATAHLDDDAKARFLMFFQPPPADVLALIEEQRSPAGVRYILETQLPKAGIPDADVRAMLAHGDPLLLRRLADRVGSARDAATQFASESGDEGKTADPPTGPGPASAAAPVTGASTPDASPTPTPEKTAAA